MTFQNLKFNMYVSVARVPLKICAKLNVDSKFVRNVDISVKQCCATGAYFFYHGHNSFLGFKAGFEPALEVHSAIYCDERVKRNVYVSIYIFIRTS